MQHVLFRVAYRTERKSAELTTAMVVLLGKPKGSIALFVEESPGCQSFHNFLFACLKAAHCGKTGCNTPSHSLAENSLKIIIVSQLFDSWQAHLVRNTLSALSCFWHTVICMMRLNCRIRPRCLWGRGKIIAHFKGRGFTFPTSIILACIPNMQKEKDGTPMTKISGLLVKRLSPQFRVSFQIALGWCQSDVPFSACRKQPIAVGAATGKSTSSWHQEEQD